MRNKIQTLTLGVFNFAFQFPGCVFFRVHLPSWECDFLDFVLRLAACLSRPMKQPCVCLVLQLTYLSYFFLRAFRLSFSNVRASPYKLIFYSEFAVPFLWHELRFWLFESTLALFFFVSLFQFHFFPESCHTSNQANCLMPMILRVITYTLRDLRHCVVRYQYNIWSAVSPCVCLFLPGRFCFQC